MLANLLWVCVVIAYFDMDVVLITCLHLLLDQILVVLKKKIRTFRAKSTG